MEARNNYNNTPIRINIFIAECILVLRLQVRHVFFCLLFFVITFLFCQIYKFHLIHKYSTTYTKIARSAYPTHKKKATKFGGLINFSISHLHIIKLYFIVKWLIVYLMFLIKNYIFLWWRLALNWIHVELFTNAASTYII